MAAERGIYVETMVRCTMEELWRHTQVPELHQQWDLRFTQIEYLPRRSEAEPQRFRYSTRIGFGVSIDGDGESTGTREDAFGGRTSALTFWSADHKSLIEKGAGYWKYCPAAGGIRFFTWYDYKTRFGTLGGVLDRVAFRPLIGWATAWSFDRLRLWIERGIKPETSFRMWVIHALARLGIGFTWLWQGLIPKLLYPSADEKAMLTAAGLPATLLPFIGVAECVIALGGVFSWRWRPFFLINALFMAAALLAVGLRSPSYLAAAFNPVTLNGLMIVLAAAGFISSKELPSASRCLRKPAEERSS